jgi:inorganic pyrophosphatase/exopolyphosphatase
VGWLHENGFDEDFITKNIFFYEDLVKEGEHDTTTVESIGMVDFNQLTREAEYLEDKVHLILDHHADYHLYSDTLETKDVQLMGSCMTLLARRLLDANVVDKSLA